MVRGMKDMEQDISSIEKRFAYGFLQKLLKWMDIAQEFIAHLGKQDMWKFIIWICWCHVCSCCFFLIEAVVSSGRVEKSPHEQEIKFFAKVRLLEKQWLSNPGPQTLARTLNCC